MLRFIPLSAALFFISNTLHAQKEFPLSWLGNWKGELLWYQGNKTEPKKVNMELRIGRSDTSTGFSWQIIYGSVLEDNRPYTLRLVDSTKGHWIIDENNGIVLDQFWIANKFCSAFTVQTSTILNNYWMDNGRLYLEFFSFSAKPLGTTGKGDKEIPFVDSYKMNSYQKAVLERE
jgi:hypothetical protein